MAFPIGGLGAGMITLEGSGALSHFSVSNKPDMFHEPEQFAVIHVKGLEDGTKVLEGMDQRWHPCFESARFLARFPFGMVELSDSDFPLDVTITGWSPFIPTDPDNSGLPVGALEYHFTITSDSAMKAIFSYHSTNFMAMGDIGKTIKSFPNGFLLHQSGTKENPHYRGGFAVFIKEGRVISNHNWWDGLGLDARVWLWKNLEKGKNMSNPPAEDRPAISEHSVESTGASVYKAITPKPGEWQTIQLLFAGMYPTRMSVVVQVLLRKTRVMLKRKALVPL